MQEAAAVEQRAGGSVCRMKAACGSSCSKAACRRQLQREGSVQEVAEGATALGGAAYKRQLQRKEREREREEQVRWLAVRAPWQMMEVEELQVEAAE
jgi:hypothetical protein